MSISNSWQSSILKKLGAINVETLTSNCLHSTKKLAINLVIAGSIAISGIAPSDALAAVSTNESKPYESSLEIKGSVQSIQAEMRDIELNNIINKKVSLSESEKLSLVNNFFNERIRYISDMEQHNKKDYWQTPRETINNGYGDCEDYAIAKYFALAKMGVDENKLKITYIKSKYISAPHMILTYKDKVGGQEVILDSLTSKIIPITKTDYKPVYAFNNTWVFAPGNDEPITGIDKLSKWIDVMGRSELEENDTQATINIKKETNVKPKRVNRHESSSLDI